MIIRVDNEYMKNFAFDGRFDAQYNCKKSFMVRGEHLESLEWNIPDELSLEHVFMNFV